MLKIEFDARAMRGRFSGSQVSVFRADQGYIANTLSNATTVTSTYDTGTESYKRPFIHRYQAAANTNPYSFGVVCIMKGLMPGDVNSLTSWAAQSANVLITYASSGSNAGALQGPLIIEDTPLTTDYVKLGGDYAPATAAGQATWFWMMSRATTNIQPGSITYGDQIYHSVIGTVGTIGSGADMEIASTDIKVGVRYRFEPLKMSIPSSFEY